MFSQSCLYRENYILSSSSFSRQTPPHEATVIPGWRGNGHEVVCLLVEEASEATITSPSPLTLAALVKEHMSLCTWLQTLSDLFLLYGKLCSLEIQIQGTVVGKAYKTMLVFSWLPNQIISLILIFGLLCQSSYFDTQMTWEIYYSNMLVGFMVNITEMLEGKSYCLIYDHKIDVVV